MESYKISATYLGRLQACYHHISKRGIMVDGARITQAAKQIDTEIALHVKTINDSWKCHVYLGAANDNGSSDSVNLNSSSGKRTPLLKLKSLGYNIPTVSKRNEDGEYESKESLAELALQKMLATNQFNILGGDPVIKAILAIRELVTLRSRYINANLYSIGGYDYFISNYNVVGTTTGRRSSRKHAFNYGNNAQNFPKHGTLARIYRRCLRAMPGYIFLMVDQILAEDWPVNALAQNTAGLTELRDGVDRHKKMACAVFQLQPDHYDEAGWKSSMERFLGKKIRHAMHYGMEGGTMSDSLAKEGISMPSKHCQLLLNLAHSLNPSIREVFHEYVKRTLYDTRVLQTPFGRERQFFGLRPGDGSGNAKIFREAFSFIPQSVVGDNTGFAVYELENNPSSKLPGAVVQEGHDSIIQQVPNTVDYVWEYIQSTIRAFKREVKFGNGISFEIPIEGEIAFNLYSTITLKNNETGSKKLSDVRYKDLQIAWQKLREIEEREVEEEDAKKEENTNSTANTTMV